MTLLHLITDFWARRSRRAHAYREMRRLPDTVLQDLGMHRDQIPALIDGSLCRRQTDRRLPSRSLRASNEDVLIWSLAQSVRPQLS